MTNIEREMKSEKDISEEDEEKSTIRVKLNFHCQVLDEEVILH